METVFAFVKSLIDKHKMTEFCDILKLSELLNPKEDENSEDEDIELPRVKAYEGEDLREGFESRENDVDEKSKDKVNVDEENLDPDELAARYLEAECTQSISDWRKTPQWEVSYRQQVTPSDVFLQMGGKTPATASCEEMILTVHLPGENRQNVDLKITKEQLDLTAPNFRLNIPLPHPVDPQRGNAQFDSNAETLIITLVLNREFDYVNF